MSGPLADVVILELGGIGPTPYCGMLLADLGASVIRVERLEACGAPANSADILGRGKRSIGLDLRHPDGAGVVRRLATHSDALIEGFRPGVAERLGMGPEVLLRANPNLVYGRMTGWGQTGPLAPTAGHDIDYLAVSGTLEAIGPAERPLPPLNLLADFGGGGMFLAVGVLAGVLAVRSGEAGQVVDAAMVDGVAHLSAMLHGALAEGWWRPQREANLLDGGAPFYGIYRCSDGRFVAVGALEPQFYAELLSGLEIGPEELGDQMDRDSWPTARLRLESVFSTRTRDDWTSHFADTDACVAPVYSLEEAPTSPHLAARQIFYEEGGSMRPSPAPRFGATPAGRPAAAPAPGSDTSYVLGWAGYGPAELDRLEERGVITIQPEEQAHDR